MSTARKIHITGIRCPRWDDVSTLTKFSLKDHHETILKFLFTLIQKIPDEPTRLNLIILPENAFTPFPIPSEKKDEILNYLQAELLKRSDQDIWLICGTFLHIRTRKMDEKNVDRIKMSLEYHQQHFETVSHLKKPNEELKTYLENEIKTCNTILKSNQTQFLGQQNTAVFLCSNPDKALPNKEIYAKRWVQRDKKDEYMEKMRFSTKNPNYVKIKNETIFLQGKATDVIHTFCTQDGTEIEFGLLICYEQSTPFPDGAYTKVKQNPVDFRIILSDVLPRKKIESHYHDDEVIVQMDSQYGLYVLDKKKKYAITCNEYHIKTPNERFYDATRIGNLSKVKDAIANGATVCHVVNDQPVFYLACEKGQCSIVEYLIDEGFNLDTCDKYEYSALHIAAKAGQLEIVKILIANHIVINELSNKNETPLLMAAGQGHFEVVKYLLQHGANINAEDINGQTSLYHAIQKENLDLVKYLLLNGAEMNESLFEVAMSTGNLNVINCLESYVEFKQSAQQSSAKLFKPNNSSNSQPVNDTTYSTTSTQQIKKSD